MDVRFQLIRLLAHEEQQGLEAGLGPHSLATSHGCQPVVLQFLLQGETKSPSATLESSQVILAKQVVWEGHSVQTNTS